MENTYQGKHDNRYYFSALIITFSDYYDKINTGHRQEYFSKDDQVWVRGGLTNSTSYILGYYL
jgi:hypothetical protein